MPFSDAEQFLYDFHNQNPGISSRAFESMAGILAGQPFASSYHALTLQVPAQSAVLDLACGDGFMLSLLTGAGHTLTGVDLSPGELAAAKQRLGSEAILLQGKAQALPLAGHSCDVVLCHMALMLMDQPERVLSEIHRVLKPGGTFAFMIGTNPPSFAALDGYLSRLRALRRQSTSAILFGDPRLHSQQGLFTLLEPYFKQIQMDDMIQSRRYTPAQVWEWFESYYDLAMLSAADCQLFKEAYLAELICDADGKIEFTDAKRRVMAIAR